MHKVFGLDSDTWAALTAIGTIIGAIGTVGAVIVALRLATRNSIPVLRVSTAIMEMTSERLQLSGLPPTEVVSISATNIGIAPAKIEGLYFTLGWFRKQQFIRLVVANPYSDSLPKLITTAENVAVRMPVSEFTKGFDEFTRYLKKRWYRRFFISGFRCGFYTSHGVFTSRADVRIRKMLTNAFEASQPAESASKP